MPGTDFILNRVIHHRPDRVSFWKLGLKPHAGLRPNGLQKLNGRLLLLLRWCEVLVQDDPELTNILLDLIGVFNEVFVGVISRKSQSWCSASMNDNPHHLTHLRQFQRQWHDLEKVKNTRFADTGGLKRICYSSRHPLLYVRTCRHFQFPIPTTLRFQSHAMLKRLQKNMFRALPNLRGRTVFWLMAMKS